MSQVRILSFRPREVAQLVEHMSEEHGVGGSIPPFSAWESTLVGEHDGVRDGSIPSLGNGGSNPPFPTLES